MDQIWYLVNNNFYHKKWQYCKELYNVQLISPLHCKIFVCRKFSNSVSVHILFDLCLFKHFSQVANFGYQSLNGRNPNRNVHFSVANIIVALPGWNCWGSRGPRQGHSMMVVTSSTTTPVNFGKMYRTDRRICTITILYWDVGQTKILVALPGWNCWGSWGPSQGHSMMLVSSSTTTQL